MYEKLDIGDYSKIVGTIDLSNPKWVHIGKYVVVGGETRIITHGPIRPFYVDPYIFIEDLVWIGFRCIILPGVKIRKATIIGAGSVVTGNTKKYSIYAGNPAKFIRYQTPKEVLRSFVIRWLMENRMGHVRNIKWDLLTKEHIDYIYDDGRYNDKTLEELL